MRSKRVIQCFAFLTLLLYLLTACGEEAIPKTESEGSAKAFILALSEARYDDASAMIHPIRESSGGDLQNYCLFVKSEYGVDLSKNLQILSESAYVEEAYREIYDGAYSAFTYTVSADGKTFTMKIEVVRNADGYGIHNFHFDFAEA